MKNRLLIPMVAIAVLAMWGCYPGSVTVSELDTVLTLFDDEEDFQRFTTFHLADTIVVIGDDDNEVDHKYDDDILNEVRQNMLDLGYEERDQIEGTDVVLLVEYSRSDLLVGWNPCPGCWCGYWCWYPGWPWYGYNPYYPWGGVVYSYPVGTVFITMFDNTGEEPPMDMVAPAPWTAAFNGLIQGSDSQILQRIERAIDQAFDQSPYLEQ